MSTDPHRLEKLCCAGPVLIRAKGSSMGDRYSGEVEFRAQTLTRKRPLPGTILLWQDKHGTIVAHRLLLSLHRFGAYRHYCKGDANSEVDRSILPDKTFIAEATAVIINGQEQSLTTPAKRLAGLAIALRALPRATLRALRKPKPTLP